jgi:hypothetical protein
MNVRVALICRAHATFTNSLPKFLPWSRPRNAAGAFSRPSTTSSRYERLTVASTCANGDDLLHCSSGRDVRQSGALGCPLWPWCYSGRRTTPAANSGGRAQAL